MRVVIDAIGVVPFGGYAVALENILAGWEELDTGDELHLLMTEGVELEIPASVEIHRFSVGRPAALKRVAVQTRAARRVCRETDADGLLGILPTTAVGPVGCPKVIMVYDMRHELLPEQFTRGRRLLRRVGYEIGYRQAAAVICISERTRDDLLRSRPWLASKPVVAVLWAAEHVDRWPRREPASQGEPYALAFGHFPNKAVDRVIDTWEVLRARGEARPLVFVGLPGSAREGVSERIQAGGLDDVITAMPWLEREEFEECFASAGLIVFPSDFEGFGLPAVEAMRLAIPLVISTDKALLEVTGGHATVVEGTDPTSLADAVSEAWRTPPEAIEEARSFVGRYSWAKTARETRDVLAAAASARRR